MTENVKEKSLMQVNIQHYIIALLATFLIVYLVIPQLMKIALKVGFTDKPTERKKHRGEIPLCGGLLLALLCLDG